MRIVTYGAIEVTSENDCMMFESQPRQKLVKISDELFPWVGTYNSFSFKDRPLLVESSFWSDGVDILVTNLVAADDGEFLIVADV